MKLHPELRVNISLKGFLMTLIFIIRALSSVYTIALFFLGEDYFEIVGNNYILVAKLMGVIIFISIGMLFAYISGFFFWLDEQREKLQKSNKDLKPRTFIKYIIGLIPLFIYFIYEFLIRSTSRNTGFRCFRCIFENESTTNLFRFLLFLLSLFFIIIVILIFFYIYRKK